MLPMSIIMMTNKTVNISVNLNLEDLCVNNNINIFQHAFKIKKNIKKTMFIIKFMKKINNVAILIHRKVMEFLKERTMIRTIPTLILIMMIWIYLIKAMNSMIIITRINMLKRRI